MGSVPRSTIVTMRSRMISVVQSQYPQPRMNSSFKFDAIALYWTVGSNQPSGHAVNTPKGKSNYVIWLDASVGHAMKVMGIIGS